METNGQNGRGKYYRFFFWNLAALKEECVTIYGTDEDWSKGAAWDMLAERCRVPRASVKASWRLTSIVIRPSLESIDGMITCHY